MSPLLHELKEGVLHLFYPRLCEGCSKPLLAGEDVLCLGCNMEIPETGYHNIADNETALRFAGRAPFNHATSYAYFTNDGLLQHLLHGLKYKNKQYIGGFLGRQFGERLKMTGWAATVDMVIPVPLHKTKKAQRGYNQSLLIAEGIGRILGKPVSDTILVRTRHTESQTNKTRTERVNNMENAFSVARPASLTGKHILLCDDVLTTGATLEACFNALLTAGHIKISIVTIGIAIS